MDTLRKQFPVLVNHPDLVYFDNAATTLKTEAVIDAVTNYYKNIGANIHRGDYPLAIEATDLFDAVRDEVAKLIHCDSSSVVYTTGASEGLNLIARGYAANNLKSGDVIVLSEVEHASNILPWFKVCQEIGCRVVYAPLNNDLSFDLDGLDELLAKEPVKIVSLAHISNVLGKTNDIKKIAEIVHKHHAIFVVDGAQSIGHIPVDVTDSDVDFFVFSSHKMTGPTAVGILYGKKHLLELTEPLLYGGDSNARYFRDGAYMLKPVPYKFETGTPNIEGIIGFGEAVSFIRKQDLEKHNQHVQALQYYIMVGLSEMSHVIVHNSISDTGIVLFNVKDIFSQDVASYLGSHNICVRAGTHCSKLTCSIFDTDSSVRASLYFYNTFEEADRFLEAMRHITIEKVVSLYV